MFEEKGVHNCVRLLIKSPKEGCGKRIFGFLRVRFANGGEDFVKCVVDTGSEFTVLPQSVWGECLGPEVAKLPRRTVRGVGGGKAEVYEADVELGLTGIENWPNDEPYELGRCKV